MTLHPHLSRARGQILVSGLLLAVVSCVGNTVTGDAPHGGTGSGGTASGGTGSIGPVTGDSGNATGGAGTGETGGGATATGGAGTGGTGGVTATGGAGTGGTGGVTATSGAGTGGAGSGSMCTADADCDDHDACTTDHCAAGSCTHTSISCDDGNACTADACDPATGCAHMPIGCDDGNACTADTCDPAAGCTHSSISCDDGNACTADTCDPAAGCTHSSIGCDDGNACTADTCDPATGCAHTPIVYFSETFADNSKGWSLGTYWQIGPEIANPAVPPWPLSNPDPTTDHTPTADNGVAGVFIGGNLAGVVEGPYYLMSPVIDLSAVSGPVTLDYWRYLNSDHPPYMNSTVEVFDGSAWVMLYSVPPNGGAPQPTDTMWTEMQHDVSVEAAGNAYFRIRWGYQVMLSSARECSSWNVDDVRILPGAPGVCP